MQNSLIGINMWRNLWEFSRNRIFQNDRLDQLLFNRWSAVTISPEIQNESVSINQENVSKELKFLYLDLFTVATVRQVDCTDFSNSLVLPLVIFAGRNTILDILRSCCHYTLFISFIFRYSSKKTAFDWLLYCFEKTFYLLTLVCMLGWIYTMTEEVMT